MDHSQYLNLERSFIGIRDERNFRANTATRIGTAFLELLRMIRTGEFDEVTFNTVTNKPTFLQGLYTYGSIILGDYIKGLQGGIITEEAFAELKDLWVREHAKIGDGSIHHDAAGRPLPALEVDGDAVFSGNLSSPEFISGFLSGLGWAIQRKEFVNSAGVTETKYSLEIDNLTVRNTLRVFEMIISQLRGENDNYVFAAMMEVDHYDPLTGKVWLSTNSGKSYMNFRKGDYIMVQRFQPGNDYKSGGDGYIIKSYELVVLDCGSGGEKDPKDENGDRLDWVRFKNFTTQMVYDEEDPAHRDVDYVGTYYTEEEIEEINEPVFIGPETLIAKGDTFCRIDNETDPERKGLMTITSVGPSTPYMDIMYGRKTDPKHALKSRIGNLEGIRTEQFGWLQGFGAYINNLYAVGNLFNSQTGESYESRIEATRESMKMLYRETLYDIREGDNKVSNGFFQNGLDDWSVVDADGDAIDEEPTVECGDKYTDPVTGKETVDWFLKGATGVEETDGLTVTDGSTVAVDGGELSAPLLFNGQVIQQKRIFAELSNVEGVQVLHLCNAGVSQDFSVVKPNSAHKKMKVDDDEFENPTKPENQQPEYEKCTYKYNEDFQREKLREQGVSEERINELITTQPFVDAINAWIEYYKDLYQQQADYLSSTDDEVDKLYFGIRILPLTDGVLRVGFLRKNEAWSESTGFSENLLSSEKWELRQACDYPEDGRAWYFPVDTDKVVRGGRLVVTYSGECYIRFVAVSNDPVSEAEREYKTLFEQNSRRIRMQAAKDEKETSDWVIQYNAIAQRVTDNRKMADKALKDILGVEYDEDSGMYIFPDDWVNPNYTYASWIIHTKNRMDFLFTKWDDDNNLVGYSDRSQTADYIRQVITGTADDPLWGPEGVALKEAFASFKLAWSDALTDGVIDARERAALDELKKSMATAFSQANAFYSKALLNPIMGNTDELADLKTKWNTLSSKYTALISAVDAVLVVNGNIHVNGAHKNLVNAVESAYSDFDSALKAFYESLAVANNYVDGELAKRVKTVQDNLTGYQQSLDREIQKAFPNKTFINWLSDTKTSSMQVLGMISLDSDGNPILTDYSLKTQTAQAIEEAVSSSEKYAENQVKALKDIIHSDVLKNNGVWGYATFKSETATEFNQIAGRFTVDGQLRSMSWIKQYADGIEDRVEDIEGLSIIKQTASTIKGVVTGQYISSTAGLSDYAKKTDLPDMTKYYAKADFEMTPSQIKQRVEGLEEKTVSIAEWEQGSSANTIKTTSHIPVNSTTKFYLNKGYAIYVGFYNASGTYISGSTTGANDFNRVNISIPSDAATCQVQITRTGGISPKQISSTGFRMTDTTIVTSAEISSFVSKDADGYLESGIKLRADQISITTIDQFSSNFSWGNLASKLNGEIEIAARQITNFAEEWKTLADNFTVNAKNISFSGEAVTWKIDKLWTIKNKNNATTMLFDQAGDLSITGTLKSGSIIETATTIDGYQSGYTMLGHKINEITFPSSGSGSVYPTPKNHGLTHVITSAVKGGNKFINLPTLGECNAALGISSGNFCIRMVFMNQSNTNDSTTQGDLIYIRGRSGNAVENVTSNDVRPYVVNSSDVGNFQLTYSRIAEVFITRFGNRFVATYLIS